MIVTRVTRQVPLAEQELPDLSSPSERKDFCSVVFKLNSTSSNPTGINVDIKFSAHNAFLE
jgi:ribosomal protein L31